MLWNIRSSSVLIIACLGFGLVVGCGDDEAADGSNDSASTSSDNTPKTDAYFLADMVRMAKQTESCDMDEDGINDNAVLAMLGVIPPQFVTKTPNETLADAIATGELLMVVGVHEVKDFEQDDDATLKLYGGELLDTDAGVPSDLYDGQGEIGVIEPAYSSITGSFDDGTLAVSSIEKVSLNVPVGGAVILTELEQPQAFAAVSPYPDVEMLNGEVPEGKICGAIKAKTLIDLATALPKVNDGLRPLLAGLINNAADLDCDGDKCLSVAIVFSAVSVSRAD